MALVFSSAGFLVFFSWYNAGGWVLVDGGLFLLIFIGLTRFVFEERFAGRGGKALWTGLGIALAISLLIFEQVRGFNLASMGFFALGIFSLIVTFFLYHFLYIMYNNL